MVLQSIRERITGVVAFIILGILVIPFAFVGVNSYFSSGNENLVARVNDADITLSEFTQSFTTYRQRMQSIMGAAFDVDEFDTLIARREHLDSLIDQRVLEQSVLGLNLDVDDRRLAEDIRRLPAFQLDGVFSPDVYQSRLASQGLSVEQFQDQMREQFVLRQLQGAIVSSTVATPSQVQEYIRLQEQQRAFRSVIIEPVESADAAPPTEEAIQAYYDDHPELFQTEEMVTIEYVELNAVEIDSGAEPDDEFLQQRFESQKGRFISPEQRKVAHILIEVAADADEAVKTTAEQEAQDIAERARSGEDFATLAETYSDDIGSAQSGGELGWMEPGIMSDSFETAMYALTLEQPVSDPVLTGFGWHVILLQEVQPAEGMSFEEARATLIAEHIAEESEREFLDKADRLIDLVYEDPTTLDAAALDVGLDIRQLGPFGRSGGEGLAADPNIVSAAFSDLVLTQGSVSDPVDLGENHIVLLKVREHFPQSVKPLADVREDIIASLRSEAALAAAQARATALLEQVEAGGDLNEVAEAEGLVVVETLSANRRNFTPDRKVVEGVFGMTPPESDQPRLAVLEATNGYALVELQSVTDGSLDANPTLNEQQIRRQIANAAASIEADAFMQQLRAAATIEVFEERLR